MTRKEAIKILMSANVWNDKERTALEVLISELRESEDERIRKTLIHIVKGACGKYGIKYRGDEIGQEELLAYLEKQKEQKPAEWSKNDTVFLNEITDFFENKTVRLQHDIDMYAHWLKSLPERFNLQPKEEWSEEDEQLIGFIFDLLNDLVWRKDWAMSKEECLGRLKSLRPSWKPSEEQMEALERTIRLANFGAEENRRKALESLYEQLKKLM